MTILQEYITDRVDYARVAISTTNDVATLIDTITIPTDQTYNIEVLVQANKENFAEKGGFTIKGLYTNNAGTVTLQGSRAYPYRQRQEGWEVVFSISSPTILVFVYGMAATNINWKYERTAYLMEDKDDV